MPVAAVSVARGAPRASARSGGCLCARLYGLTSEDLRCILDPEEVCGPDFPGETFRVLKDKEEKRYGEYRTKRLVLEAWEALEWP